MFAIILSNRIAVLISILLIILCTQKLISGLDTRDSQFNWPTKEWAVKISGGEIFGSFSDNLIGYGGIKLIDWT